MIVVIGQPVLRRTEAGAEVAGLPGRIAVAAAAHGHPVELVGTAGEDEAGDVLLSALAKAGVGHVAVLRKAGVRTPTVVATDDHADSSVEAPSALDEAESDFATAAGIAAPLDAGDVDLALRYLTESAVLVLAGGVDPGVARVVANAASWAAARLIVVVPTDEQEPAGLPQDAIVFAAPDTDPDGVFAAMVGSFAAALDDGDDPAAAFRSSLDSTGWTLALAD